tara:strand:- start:3827 stop:4927 length:1101 start_codon:yes stop_codon:yes gene_type:complete
MNIENEYSKFLTPIDEIITYAKKGKMFILVDENDRENEGDLIIPAEKITPENINFMAKFGRGLICLSLTKNRINELELPLMNPINQNNDLTAFTVSIEAKEGVSTGISAADRAHTILVAINDNKTKNDIISPGHVFPLMAWDGGVLERAGHTEASVDISKLASLNPSAVICEIMNDDGTMSRLPELIKFSSKHNIPIGTVSDLIAYRLKNDTIVEFISESSIESYFNGNYKLLTFKNILSNEEHYALVHKDLDINSKVFVRMHKHSIVKDILTEKNLFDEQMQRSVEVINKKQNGVIVIINGNYAPRIEKQFSRNKDEKFELREYGVGAQILRNIGLKNIILLTNNEKKVVGLDGFGLKIINQESF